MLAHDELEVDVNEPNINGKTPLNLAAKKGDTETVMALLKHSDIDPNRQNEHDDAKTPLHYAVQILQLQQNPTNIIQAQKIVQALLDHPQTNPNIKTRRYDQTPLFLITHNVPSSPQTNLAKQTIITKLEKDYRRQDENGNTPLHRALITKDIAEIKTAFFHLYSGKKDYYSFIESNKRGLQLKTHSPQEALEAFFAQDALPALNDTQKKLITEVKNRDLSGTFENGRLTICQGQSVTDLMHKLEPDLKKDLRNMLQAMGIESGAAQRRPPAAGSVAVPGSGSGSKPGRR